MSSRDPRQDSSEACRLSTLLRRFFPLYCAVTVLVTYGYALYDNYQLDGDAIAYMDIGDCLRAHQWAGIVNGYWHPMYPAFLSLGHVLFRATLPTELRAYYFVNFAIFLLEMLAVVCFSDAIERMRKALEPAAASESESRQVSYLLDRTTLRYLGVTLVVIASQRELSLGKIRPDALLQAFLLLALAALLTHLATNRLRYAVLMGLALGCAYLTKSFAFLFAFLCIFILAIFRWLWLKHSPTRILPATLIALATFACVAGPYVAALSHQKGRLDFGDSGPLNYAWYVDGTEKMHLQPYMTWRPGSAEIHLKHPERELLRSPLILSYAELPYGTYPDWFDPSYWNDHIEPRFNLRGEAPRVSRNLALAVRYIFNHPEALILLALFLLPGARFSLPWRPAHPGNAFWLVPVLLGLSIWGIYAVVNTEERYVTVAYICIELTLFAALRLPAAAPADRGTGLRESAVALMLFLALLAIGESLRAVLEDRRQLSIVHSQGDWYSPTMAHAAGGLRSLGVKPGDTVACVGSKACLDDQYWARLAGVRILTEVYDPETPVPAFLDALPDRNIVMAILQAQGAVVLVGDFDRARINPDDPALKGWQQLGDTTFYSLPLPPAIGHQP